MRVWLRVVPVLVSAAVCSGSAAGGLPRLLLPDLDQRPPLAVSVRWGGPSTDRHPRLVFTSSVENVGFGPLLVEGRRASHRVKTMRAAQLIETRSGGFVRVPGVGRLKYNVNPSHSHWHLLPFERYELRTLAGKQILRDHKTGFCLTSDHRSPLRTLGPHGHPVDKTDCERNKPGALRVFEGIAVGWGDIYIPAKEGQYVDINGVPPGDYVLVHRVNVDRLMRETSYRNDDSSLRIRLLPPPTPEDLPGVQVLKTCETGTRC
jgi:lysyl oxidase